MHKYFATISLMLIFIFVSNSILADSWMLPSVKEYESEDKKIRLTVLPLVMRDRVIQSKCRIKLDRIINNLTWSAIWARNCVNDISPTNALVTNSGKYVVTFDNWYETGVGSNVVVIYNANGKLVRSFSLMDLMSQEKINQLPRSVSSIQWGFNHYIHQDQETLVLNIADSSPGVLPFESNAKFVKIKLRLANGNILSNSTK
jgi:hypothetical protein